MSLDTEQKKRAAAIAAWLFLFEKRAKNALKRAIGASVRHTVALGAGQVQTRLAVRSASSGTLLRIRTGSRAAAASEWRTSTGVRPRVTFAPASDAARADRVAGSLASAWSDQIDRAVEEGTKWSRAATDAIGAIQTDRAASTETVSAFNDEIADLNGWAIRFGLDLVETWSAMADACPKCWDMDGEERRSPDTFLDRPPLHPRCRCVILTRLESMPR